MKKITLLIVFCFSFVAFAQVKKQTYEQVIINSCENEDKNASCFYNTVEKKVRQILNEEIQTKIKKDTVYVWLSFNVDKKRDIITKGSVKVNTKKGKEIQVELLKYLKALKPTNVTDRKLRPLLFRHYMEFKYLYNWKNDIKYQLLEPNNVYKGGVLFEVHAYAGCKSSNPKKRKESLSEGISKHVNDNFIYQNFTDKFNMKDKLVANLLFDKNGKIKKMSFDSIENELVLTELKRIFSIMPAIQPKKIDGKPQTTKLRLPINIR